MLQNLLKETAAEEALAAVGIGGVDGAHLAEGEGAHGGVEVEAVATGGNGDAGGMHGSGAVAGLGHDALGQGQQCVGDRADDGAAGVEPRGFFALVAQDEAVAL